MYYETKIARYFKLSPRVLVIFSVIGLGALSLLNWSTIVKQMDAWQLLPREQRFTELYFSDHHKIPTSADAETTQNVAFTLHNLEHITTTYSYRVVAVTSDNRTTQVLDTGDVRLGSNQSISTSRTITIPQFDSPRAGIRVDLEYQGIAFGDTTPSLEKQSIQYWVKLGGKENG
jgi:hypothetical protein